MKILLIKTSSLGDVIHTLPALSDALCVYPDLQVDWVVEEKMTTLPALHPAVKTIIPVAIRRWRKSWSQAETRHEVKQFIKNIRAQHYDKIIDAQGLLKSVWIGLFARGTYYGYRHPREKFAAIFYRHRSVVDWNLHAVERVRMLFANALAYTKPATAPDYGLDRTRWQVASEPYVVFFHGTTWKNKHWPEVYWIALANLLNTQGLAVKLSWGTEQEKLNSEAIAKSCKNATVLERLDIQGLLPVIASATAVVAVDTGLCHLAAALNIPTAALYGPTDPKKTGIIGPKQQSLAANFACAPCLKRECHYQGPAEVWPACFARLPPQQVFEAIMQLLA